VKYHTAHTTPGQNHIAVYYKQNRLFSLNTDGTAHDRSHGIRIPNKVVKGIQQRFPDIQIPPNNIIEAATLEQEAEVLAESHYQAAKTKQTGRKI
jgi:outer membrane protein assembly factor BamA